MFVKAGYSIGSLLAALKESSRRKDVLRGKELHLEAVESGLISDTYVATSLINMYSKCSCMVEAHKVFDDMKSKNLVSWTALMLGYATNGEPILALEIFQRMAAEGFHPDRPCILGALKACSGLAAQEPGEIALAKGREIHVQAMKLELVSDMFVASSLVDMYVKCGSLADARPVFDQIPCKDVVSWTALISGYVQNGEYAQALLLFCFMQLEGCQPSSHSFVAAFKACSGLASQLGDDRGSKVLKRGETIYRQAVELGCDTYVFVACSLIEFYIWCRELPSAREVFTGLPSKNVVLWTSLIFGHAQNGEPELALEMFGRMQLEGCSPDAQTLLGAVQACASLAGGELREEKRMEVLERGMKIHSQALMTGQLDVFLASSLIDMYSKCRCMACARDVFERIDSRDVFSWTALIDGYVLNGELDHALELFETMEQVDKCSPNARTFTAALKSCGELSRTEPGRALETAMAVHSLATVRGLDTDTTVVSALVEMYSSCGSLEDAQRSFDRTQQHAISTSTWNSLLSAYLQNGQPDSTLHRLACMDVEGTRMDIQTFVLALKASAELGELQTGRVLHSGMSSFELKDRLLALNCLVDFYSKCGSMAEAQAVFDSACHRDVVTWTSLIVGYGRQGEALTVLGLLRKMRDDGLQPNCVTMLAVLIACSHAGLVDEARDYLERMKPSYGLSPAIEHYHCVIDMLGRANRIEEALLLSRRMPYEPNTITWTCLLDACSKWKNSDVGRLAFRELLKLDENRASAYELMFGSLT